MKYYDFLYDNTGIKISPLKEESFEDTSVFSKRVFITNEDNFLKMNSFSFQDFGRDIYKNPSKYKDIEELGICPVDNKFLNNIGDIQNLKKLIILKPEATHFSFADIKDTKALNLEELYLHNIKLPSPVDIMKALQFAPNLKRLVITFYNGKEYHSARRSFSKDKNFHKLWTSKTKALLDRAKINHKIESIYIINYIPNLSVLALIKDIKYIHLKSPYEMEFDKAILNELPNSIIKASNFYYHCLDDNILEAIKNGRLLGELEPKLITKQFKEMRDLKP